MVNRWLSKIANYLTNELATDLFGSDEPAPTRIYTSLQPWQDVLWQIAARAMGWELLDTRRPLPGDLFVTNSLGPEARDALAAGAHVLAQPRAYLSFAWDARLDGAVDTPELLASARDEALAGLRAPEGVAGSRVALLWEGRTGAGQVLDQWMQGRSVVLIDPHVVSPERLPQILATEAADAGLVTYAR